MGARFSISRGTGEWRRPATGPNFPGFISSARSVGARTTRRVQRAIYYNKSAQIESAAVVYYVVINANGCNGGMTDLAGHEVQGFNASFTTGP